MVNFSSELFSSESFSSELFRLNFCSSVVGPLFLVRPSVVRRSVRRPSSGEMRSHHFRDAVRARRGGGEQDENTPATSSSGMVRNKLRAAAVIKGAYGEAMPTSSTPLVAVKKYAD